MNLNKDKIAEINTYLADPKVIVPPFRREVTSTGGNYLWLKKHIQTKNDKLPKRLLELLELTT